MAYDFGEILSGAGSSVVEGLFSAYQADKNRAFQRDMSNTSHQREVRDLIKAGLNPILSVNRSGASTPSGSVAATPNVSGNTANAIARKRLLSEVQVMDSQRDKNYEDANTAKALQKLYDAQTEATNYENSERKVTSDFYENDYGDLFKDIEKITNSSKGLGNILKFLFRGK